VRRSRRILLVVPVLVIALAAAAIGLASEDGKPERRPPRPLAGPPAPERVVPVPPAAAPQDERPPEKRRSPNRHWRRWGTARLVRLVLQVAREYRAAHPRAARMAVGDLSRPRGGDFGPQFGYIGHASHQNGLDVDVYYPRADGRERAPRYASQIDRALSQELVDRFVAKGAVAVYVGPNTGLQGPPGIVQALVNHDNHVHVRIP
jgi:murein endopeptidase